ncbi:MAG: trans-2-enoyl-CoA reductase family protein [Prosthecobacter sp.]|jgi:enoyl-[acyl-carrier protein] reductase/trans-2-enoyl-CoA reductase (NAD+)|uniref:enoyl-ACP reductase FabV n=1 Tax=Prosthecobacter sp. TaxID=1965333 RepID=UPI0019FFA6B3|nr:enoyl-ACP reductase FabV [Prosthecobacter sp.]MBE2287509.1 trans-2-enoyl-CoA reductase family protein [Prosthecobacter sp.]
MIVAPKIRGFICTTAHPTGCAKHVADQIAVVKSRGPIANGPKKVLVIGSSTGYGLSSRIAAAFGCGAATIGVFFEKPGEADRCGTAGWYNSAAFENEAKAAGLYARSFNGDAFSDPMKAEVIEAIKQDLGQVDCVVYSLASPRRTHPKTGEVFKSCLKPIGGSYTNKNLNTGNGVVNEVTIEPANEDDIAQTVAVMGGEDWEMWIDALQAAGVLAQGVQTVAYSYIGPEVTWPIYKNGTIGRAKEDLERVQRALDGKLAALGGKAWVSVNKALVTQASSAIPVVPLYISLLYKVMKAEGTHEDCIEQMDRLFRERLYNGQPQPDEAGRIRVDDWEMTPKVQQLVDERWKAVCTENLSELGDFEGYQSSFLRLFGFGLEGVDYNAEVDTGISVPSLG